MMPMFEPSRRIVRTGRRGGCGARLDQRGLTLVELTVVLVVLAILMAAAYPLLGNVLQVMISKGAAEQVAGAIRQARQYAITRGTNHCIEFSASPSTRYQIRQAPDNTNCSGAIVNAWVDVGNGAAVTNPSPAPAMIFNPVGSVTLPAVTPVTFSIDTQPASCLSTLLVTLYGGVRVSRC